MNCRCNFPVTNTLNKQFKTRKKLDISYSYNNHQVKI